MNIILLAKNAINIPVANPPIPATITPYKVDAKPLTNSTSEDKMLASFPGLYYILEIINFK